MISVEEAQARAVALAPPRMVERVGLRALAFGTGKGAHAGGIDQTHRHALLMQEPQQRLFITAAGLADHLHGAERPQAFQQLTVTGVGVRHRPRGVLGLDLQGILGDVDGDIVGRMGWEWLSPSCERSSPVEPGLDQLFEIQPGAARRIVTRL